MNDFGNSANAMPDATGTRRMNVVFSNDQFAKLQKIATSQNITLSDALRQAIGVSSLVVDANSDPETQILLKKEIQYKN